MYESFTAYLTSIYGFGGRYRFEGTFVELCWECLQDMLGILPLIYLHNSSTIWVELEKKTKEVHHDWILTIQVSCLVKNISVPVVKYRAHLLTWPAYMLVFTNKRKFLHKKRVQFAQDCLGTSTWPPFHCFRTPRWPPWRYVNTLYMRMAHKLSLKVYKVKACLLCLKCRVSSKI